MSLFNKKNLKGGIMDEIRCDEPSYLIWKWRPLGKQLGENVRENSIRWGSPLRVKDGEVAIFVYKQKDGTIQDCIEGPFDEIIKTKNLPILASIIGLAYEGGTPFQAEVYFVNLAKIVQTKFAVPFFDVYDPRFEDFVVPVAVRGTLTFSIADYRDFIKLHRLNDFNLEEFQSQIRDAIIRYVKDAVTNAPSQNNISIVQIESRIGQINDIVELDIKERLLENFGVNVSGVDINTIEIDKTSDGYRQLMAVTKDVTAATIQAETEARVKDIADKQRIEVENYEEMLRIQREEAQYAQHMATQTTNLGAFQTEKQAEVGVAGADALGHMGSNGAGNINMGGDGGNGLGFNPAAMAASMAVGGVVGQNIAGVMSNVMSGVQGMSQSSVTPPPLPVAQYHVEVNGQNTGPYALSVVQQMINDGQIKADTLIWKSNMTVWTKASEVEEFKTLFSNPPDSPSVQTNN